MRLLVLLAGLAVLGSCYDNGYPEGSTCDPALNGRDCEPDLACIVSYDICPQFGCPRCRRFCETDLDCSASSTACETPQCVRQSNNELQDQGVCTVCQNEPYFWPIPD